MKKKIMMVVLAGVLVGSMESAMVYAGRMPELTKTESSCGTVDCYNNPVILCT